MRSSDRCFLCARSLEKVGTSREHIIPRWVLRKYNLFDRTVTISDQTNLAYKRHTVPCCLTCNAFLGQQVEQPIRETLLQWPQTLERDIRDTRFLEKLFCWLSLLNFKSLYKDVFLTRYNNESQQQFRLGEGRDWFIHHHVNTLCRLAFPELTIDPHAFGSLLFFVLPEDGSEPFDFITIHEASTIMVRVSRVALVAALNDSCGALTIFNDTIGRSMPNRPLDILDVREILGHITVINEYLEERPQYHTLSDRLAMRAKISVTLPSKGPVCSFDPTNSEHHEKRRLIWKLLFSTYECQMTKDELSLLNDGTLSCLARNAACDN